MMMHSGPTAKICWILVIIGGLNWGLVGLGMLIGTNLNVVNLIFGGMPVLEAIIYLVVGLATICKLFCHGKMPMMGGSAPMGGQSM
jgi:uncharacterized membrane protein YuzA (DUF378 family)